MAITIGNNIASLRAQRILARVSEDQAGIAERLSSGQRINRASDDAAGLAVSSALSAKGRVLTQAVRNIGDGISLLNIAEGALTELREIVTRQSELASQAANGIYSERQRLGLQRESDALVDEYNRIVQSTEFNRIQLLDGSTNTVSLQVGSSGNDQIGVSVGQSLGPAAGTGTFQSGVTLTLGGSFVRTIATADIDGDGNLDLVRAGLGTISINRGNGDGTFADRTVASFTFAGSETAEVHVADVDRDGRMDVLVGSDNGTVSFVRGNGDGTFKTAVSYNLGFGSHAVVDLVLRDFNNDGNEDLAAAVSAASGGVAILLGRGDGTFGAQISVTSGLASSVKSADLNGDGLADLVVNKGFASLEILLGQAGGTFSLHATFSNGGPGAPLAVLDADRDGDVDIVYHAGGTTNRVMLNDGRAIFTQSQSFSAGRESETAVADLNGDGILDLIGVGIYPHRAHPTLGRGDGTFSAPGSLPLAFEPSEVAVGDFNNDGVPDFSSGDFNGQSMLYLGIVDPSGRRNPYMYKLDLLTAPTARSALDTTAMYLNRITDELSSIGATRARLDVGSRLTSALIEENKAAEVRILDADIAAESADYVRTSILQRTAAAVLAQANVQPDIALRLLRR